MIYAVHGSVALKSSAITVTYNVFINVLYRDSSLGDVRASSGDLSRMPSNFETPNPMANQDRQKELNHHSIGDGARFQSGVLRTNCIDCLDRTNVAQYAYGLAALGRQLQAMGLTDIPKVDPDSSTAAALMDMYQSMGDALAQQYGGSAAHNTVRFCLKLCPFIDCQTYIFLSSTSFLMQYVEFSLVFIDKKVCPF